MFPVCRKKLIVFSQCFLAGVFVRQYILRTNQPATVVSKRPVTWKNIFDDPLNPDRKDCRNLLHKPKLDKDFYSPKYPEHRRQFDEKFRRVAVLEKPKRNNRSAIEGHSGRSSHQSRLFRWLAGRPWVNTICETGFNAGHSTLQWLTGSDHAHVYSFDIGYHNYTRPMADYLNRTFPGRLHLTFGNSLKTLPRFAARHPEVNCDIILVDGGHDHSVAFGDLINFRKLVNVERNVLILDDINKKAIRKAWRETQAAGLAVQRFSCSKHHRRIRFFVVGHYV